MSMPYSSIARTALGCRLFGWLPALAAVIVPQDPRAHLDRSGRWRDEPQARVQRRSGRGQEFSATRQVDAVVGIAAVSRAAPHRHQPACPELAEVVRDEALPLAREDFQLADLPVGARQFAQQPPAQRVAGQPQEPRRGAVLRCDHPCHSTSRRFDRSIWIV
jgi:hypothetical protein